LTPNNEAVFADGHSARPIQDSKLIAPTRLAGVIAEPDFTDARSPILRHGANLAADGVSSGRFSITATAESISMPVIANLPLSSEQRLVSHSTSYAGETGGMSFLDNLENNLKALESLESGGLDDSKSREAERVRAIAAAPWAERLKSGPYIRTLMRDLTRAGFARRMKVNFVWIGTTLRLEALDQRLDLEPMPGGVDAVFPDHRATVDLEREPDALIREWMEMLDRKIHEQKAAPREIEED